jgi:diglucosylglycerate octanoyltransferase
MIAEVVGDHAGPLRLVVIGDSTCFTDASGPQLPDHPDLYPNVAARELGARLGREVRPIVVARAGHTVREAARTVTKDRHVQFDVLAGADAVVVGVGSFDHAPGGIPAVVDAIVPFVRPAPLRRRLRKGLHAAYPHAVRATLGRRRRTPRRSSSGCSPSCSITSAV